MDDEPIVNPDEILDSGVGKRHGYVKLLRSGGDAAVLIPVAVITGRREGPTVWVNAALHGDEFLGPASVLRLLADLDVDAVRGQLILTPTLNPGGTRTMRRTDPTADVDLNRAWPNAASGSTADVVSWACATLLSRTDVVIDLHSGGNRFLQHPFAVFPRTGNRASVDSAALAKACGLPWVWAHHNSILDHALITRSVRDGKPAVLLEIGGEGKAEPGWIDAMTGAVRGAMAQAGALDGEPRFLASYRVFDGLHVVRNREEGLWERAVEPGQSLEEGDLLGRVVDLLGREREAVRSPRVAAVAGICTYGFVPADDYAAEIASGFHEEGPPA